jgi:nicotinate-nucleotide adenylyltransferase
MGHLLIAEDARQGLGLDTIVFIPAGRPWLKADQKVTEPEHRLAMVELAVTSNPNFEVSDIEVRRPGATYTVDTLEQLLDEYNSNTEIFLILGMDSLNELTRWRNPERLFDLCTIVGISRPGQDDIDRDKLESIAESASDKVILIPGPSLGISGTDIRDRVADGRSIRYRVPEAVESYILEHGLYTR